MNTITRNSMLRLAHPRSRGLTLVEILVALLIMSIGLLGLAGLQTLSLKFNTSAYYRSQATALSYDFVDRMRANRPAARSGAYNVAAQDPPACDAAHVAGSVAEQDIATWRNALACRIPQSTGEVAIVGNDVTVTVRWNDSQGEDEFMFRTAL